MTAISKMPQLEALTITTRIDPESINIIAKSTSITTLAIWPATSGVYLQVAKVLAEMPLQELRLTYDPPQEQMMAEKVEDVDNALSFVFQNSATLSSIKLTSIYLAPRVAAILAGSSQYKIIELDQLSFDGGRELTQTQVADMVTTLSKSRSITTISLKNFHTKFMWDDEELDGDNADIYRFKLTPEIAKALATMPTLHSLTLDFESIVLEPADKVLDALSRSTSLTTIKFYNPRTYSDITPQELAKYIGKSEAVKEAFYNLKNRLSANFLRGYMNAGIVVTLASYRANMASQLRDSILGGLTKQILQFLDKGDLPTQPMSKSQDQPSSSVTSLPILFQRPTLSSTSSSSSSFTSSAVGNTAVTKTTQEIQNQPPTPSSQKH